MKQDAASTCPIDAADEIKRLREALIEARICLVNYSDRRYAARVWEALQKIGKVMPD